MYADEHLIPPVKVVRLTIERIDFTVVDDFVDVSFLLSGGDVPWVWQDFLVPSFRRVFRDVVAAGRARG